MKSHLAGMHLWMLYMVLFSGCAVSRSSYEVGGSGEFDSSSTLYVAGYGESQVLKFNGRSFRSAALLGEYLRRRGITSLDIEYLLKTPAQYVVKLLDELRAESVIVNRLGQMTNGPANQAEYEEFKRTAILPNGN